MLRAFDAIILRALRPASEAETFLAVWLHLVAIP